MKSLVSNCSRFVVLCFFFIVPALHVSAAEYLTASGCSISREGYLIDLAKEYERRTGTKVFVRGGGTVVGIEDLKSGKVDFAASCRPRASGDPDDFDFVQVAWGALVFVTHRANRINSLSLEQVRAIYSGKITTWSQLGGADLPIRLFVSESRSGGLSGVESSLKEMVLNDQPIQAPHTSLPSSGFVEQSVEKTPGGFAATGFPSARKRALKILKLDGVSPTTSAIRNNTYHLKRPLFLVISKNANPGVKKFVDFAISREGQAFIHSTGAVPLFDVK